MNEDEKFLTEQARLMEAEAERIRQEAEEAAADPAAQVEWIRQSNLIYGGLAGAGLVVVQPFLTETSLNASALVCVIAFAVSIPLLAALLVLNRQEEFRHRATKSPVVEVAKAVAQGSAFVGLTAAFWHMSIVAGIVFLAVGIVAVGVHSSGYVRLEYDSKFRSRFRPRKTPDA
jgi:fatty acid desaturase